MKNMFSKQLCNLLFICRRISTMKPVRPLELMPGPRSFPLIGTLWKYFPVIGEYTFDRLHWNGFRRLKQYGPIVREEIVPGVVIVWVFKPEDIEIVYRSEGRFPERRSHLALEKYRLDRPSIYNSGGLLPTNGEEWWRIRKIFQKDLNKIQNVRLYLDSSDMVVKKFLNSRVKEHVDDILPELSRLFLELTGLVAFDEPLGCFEDPEVLPDSRTSKLIDAAATINSSLMRTDNGLQLWKKFNTPLYKKLSNAHSYLDEIAKEFVFKKKAELELKSDSKQSLLGQYLLNSELDIKDVTGMVADMLLAGIDTLAYTGCFALYHISRNTDEQEMMFKELSHLMQNCNDTITEDKLAKSIYTRAVMKEIFRLSPISVGVGRILAKDATLSGYRVPAKTVVVTQNQITCRLPEYFPEPDKFIPERWVKGNPHYRSVHPYLVLPFGHGPRTCIARRLAEQNLQIFLMNVVRRYKLIWEGKELDSKSVQINKPDKCVRIQFHRR